MKKERMSSEQKLSIVMAMFKAEESITQICHRFGISQAYAYKLKERALKGMLEGLKNPGKTSQEKMLQKEIKDLQRYIGKQAIVIEELKKTLE